MWKRKKKKKVEASVEQVKDKEAYDAATVAEIDQTMKKHADNMLHALEGVSARLTQLESRTCHLECFVDGLKLSIANDHGSTDGKLRQMENILGEKDVELEMAQNERIGCVAILEGLGIGMVLSEYKHVYKFYASSRRSPKLNCNLQICKSPRKTNHNLKSQNPPLNTIQSLLHSTNLSPRLWPLSHNLHHNPLPVLLQPLRSKTYLLKGTHIIHRLISRSQIPPTNNTKSSGPGYTDCYPFNGPNSHYSSGGHGGGSYAMKPRLLTAQILPQALPTPSSIVSGSESGNRVLIDDVVEKLATMGFSREQAQATARKLTENGQSVDLNVVLDKLMNDGGSS
ncbi:hypothetical protein QJS10_CPA01g01374 [Acorus calamus]|uniref:DUF1421 domain-containing protein n=1 Tax=Acorus calamus TaxID=4465 RepID=A0AAV9FI02_ACOCL|nr:hypothetical protein QJS10_CPA01g01374 [Acorus calamus]